MGKERQKFMEKLKNFFEDKEEVLFSYLFGSVALENFTPESDVDVAVFLDEEKCEDLFERRVLMMEELEGVLGKPVEVVVLNEIRSVFFKFVIVKEGKLIFERDHQKRVEFEFKAMQDYYDFKPFLEEYNKAYIKRELARVSATS